MTDATGQLLDLVGQEAAERLHLRGIGQYASDGGTLISNLLMGRKSIKGGFVKLPDNDDEITDESNGKVK